MSVLKKLLSVDRRIIFLFIAASIVIPALVPAPMPIKATEVVKRIYDRVESLPAGSVILISNDYEPGSKAELYPMTVALLRHCFRKGHRVLMMSLWPGGVGMGRQALEITGKEYGKKEGDDYVLLGYKPGGFAVIVSMGQDILSAFPKDSLENSTRSLPFFRETKVKTLRDIDLMVSISAGTPGIDQWVVYGRDQYRFDMAGGCTGVMAPDFYPYLDTGQLVGLMGAVKGAADYEALLGRKGDASIMMLPQSCAHLVIIAFVILGNIAFLAERLSRRRKR